MNILVADDDPVTARRLEVTLREWGHTVTVAPDGLQAWEWLSSHPGPWVVILDWQMPGIDGLELCRKLRARTVPTSIHVIMLSVRVGLEDVVAGLGAGADDYMKKPFETAELRARVDVGARSVLLQEEIRRRLSELERAIAHADQLRALLPICSYCKKVRDDGNYWHQVEEYLATHSQVRFSHSVCPACYESVVLPQLKGIPP